MTSGRMVYLVKRTLYFGTVLAVAALTVWLYLAWLERSALESPDLIAASSYVYRERIPARGLLVWDEEIVVSRADGLVYYPAPGPRRVARGETVASIESKSGRVEVRSEIVGYFVPGLDGSEGNWRYSSLWAGTAPLPAAPPLVEFSSGRPVRRGEAIGKIIPQPQDLRCVTYVDLTPSLEKDIRAGFASMRLREGGRPARVPVRASQFIGVKTKLYLTLPFFPAEMARSREISFILETGESLGVLVPETSVMYRGGKLGVLQVDGNVASFKEVWGMPVEGGNFFIQKGLQPGNVVVLDADGAKEGKIRLW